MPSLSSTHSGQGFHFTLTTTVSVEDSFDLDQLTLHLVYDLDPHVYADQYELAQRPGYSSLLWGTSDLEKPVSAVPTNGSVLLLKADTSQLPRHHAVNLTLEVPLHARYGGPAASVDGNDAFYRIHVKRPLGFFTFEQQGDVSVIPDTLRPYASLSGWPTGRSSLIPDTSSPQTLEVTIPVGVLDDLAWVDIGTAAVMIAMFFYLLQASLRTAGRLSRQVSTKTD
ncbi:PIG-X [Trametes meyenii]|nr:PIG-X [Trametes meyenii]